MKWTYRLHYPDYAIGENEQLYEQMAKKGWQLKKRGQILSRFQRQSPADTVYRIELSSPGLFSGTLLPEDLIQFYEDCGWHYVTGYDLVHVFSAPPDTAIQDFYQEPQQQAETVRHLIRSYRRGIMISLVTLLLVLPILLLGNNQNSATKTYLLSPYLFWIYGLLILVGFWRLIKGWVQSGRLYRSLNKGIALDHRPKKRHRFSRICYGVYLMVLLLLSAATALQVAQARRHPLPTETSEPYLLLSELGDTSPRTQNPFSNDESSVCRGHSVLSTYWDVAEYTSDGYLFQEVYFLHHPALSPDMAPLLVKSAVFARSLEYWTPLSVEGFDWAYASNNSREWIFKKGNWYWYLLCDEDTARQTDVPAQLAKKIHQIEKGEEPHEPM